MIEAAALALRDVLSPPFRTVLLKSLGLTIAALLLIWLALQWLFARWVELPYSWADTGASVLAGIVLLVALGFLVAPVTALVAGIFLDEAAEAVERIHYSHQPLGQALPLPRSLATAVRFFGLVLLVNAVALPLVLIVGFGFLIFLIANAYLLGREYFELAALRFYDERTVRGLRARHSGRIFAGGLAITLLLAVPFANLIAPLFATALMVHVRKRIAAEEASAGRIPAH